MAGEFDALLGSLKGGLNWTLDATGLDWVTGPTAAIAVPKIQDNGDTAVTFLELHVQVIDKDTVGSNPPVPVNYARQGAIGIGFPNHGAILYDIAVSVAAEAMTLLELATALQTVSDPQGGIKIKDQLDPYHYEVIKAALEENGDPVPAPASKPASELQELGGKLTASGVLSYAGPVLSGLTVVADKVGVLSVITDKLGIKANQYRVPYVTNPVPSDGNQTGVTDVPTKYTTFIQSAISAERAAQQVPSAIPTPGLVTIATSGGVPDYTYPLKIWRSAQQVKSICMKYISFNFRNAIDVQSQAIITKNTLSDFNKEVSDNALKSAEREVPDWREPTGATDNR